MKNTLLILVFIATSLSAIAQDNKIDKRLLVKYTVEELNTIKAEKPEEYKMLNYCIENAFYIAPLPKEKVKAKPSVFQEITLESLSISNFFDLKINILEEKSQYFIITGTEKLLIVKPRKQILQELNN